jgi:hypothetical protein
MKIKKYIATLIIGAMLSTSTVGLAQSIPIAPAPVAGEVDPGNAISPMKKGQTAPFTGVLLSPQAVATITVNLNSIADKIKIEVTKAHGDDKAQCDALVNTIKINADADSKRLNAQLTASKADNKVITDRLAKAEKSAPNLSLWVGGGVLGGIVLTLVTTFAVGKATK